MPFLRRVILFAVLGAVLAHAPVVRAELNPQQVREAIDSGIKYLKRTQQANGSWPDYQNHEGGVTGLCTLALLNSGLTAEDETVRKALQWLRAQKFRGVYARSVQTMALAVADPANPVSYMPQIKANVEWLEAAQLKPGSGSPGGWGYTQEHGASDNSNAQFALLALHEAERAAETAGLTLVKPNTWQLALRYWRDQQNADGSWGYLPRGGGFDQGTGSMTCAGLASLIIASDELNKGDAEVRGDEVICCGQQSTDEAIERGLDWLARNFTAQSNPANRGLFDRAGANAGQYHFYYLYGVERVGRMTARRFLGRHDWYREGADVFLNDRPPDSLSGFWKGVGHGETDPNVSTSLALLFLSKGRRPVVMGKLRHGPGSDWNLHRSDAANLTRYAEKKWGRDLTWQVLDPKGQVEVEDLLQTPVIYISGREGLDLTKGQAKLLRQYVDRGGFIFAEACCQGSGFDTAFRKLMSEIFPEREYKLSLLPPNHPVWRAEEPVDPDYVKELYGIDVGCRTSVIYCPDNLSCYWELARPGRGRKFPDEVQRAINAAQTLGVNVLAYATNRELKFKDEIPTEAESHPIGNDLVRGQIRVAKLQHPGGCDAAPVAVSNLMRAAAANLGAPTDAEVKLIRLTDPALFNHNLVFMHGRNAFSLSANERKALRTFVERGGTLVADAICSSDAFSESFRREMAAVFPDHPLGPIPADHAMFSPQFGGADLKQLRRRDPQAGAGDRLETAVRQVQPDLEGVRLGERYGVIFSRYDISCALESHESLECKGYVREDASRLGLNLLLYALHQ